MAIKTQERLSAEIATKAATFMRFDPRRYLYDPESLREQAESGAEILDDLAREQDWQALNAQASRMKDLGEVRLQKLLRGRTVLNDVIAAANDLETYLIFQNSDDGTGGGAKFLTELLDLIENVDQPALVDAAIQDLMADETSISGDRINLQDDVRRSVYPRMLRKQRDMSLWYIVSGYMVLVEAALYAMVEHTTPVEYSPAVFESIAEQIESVRNEAMDLFRNLYSSLAGEQWDDVAAYAWRATSYPNEVIHDLYPMAWTLREGRRFEAENESGAPGQAAAFAQTEMELNRVLRLLGTLLGAGYRFLFIARKSGIDEESREAAEAARDKRFESIVRDGVNVDLPDLLDNAGEYDSRLVEVEGFAENVRFVAEDAVTRFDVVDRLHDRRLPVFYPYHDLTDWDFRDNAYVRIEGDFDADSEWTDGPELQVDTVNLAENGEESWFDAVVHELGRSNVFELYPSRGNLFWSLEPPAHEASSTHDHNGGGD